MHAGWHATNPVKDGMLAGWIIFVQLTFVMVYTDLKIKPILIGLYYLGPTAALAIGLSTAVLAVGIVV